MRVRPLQPDLIRHRTCDPKACPDGDFFRPSTSLPRRRPPLLTLAGEQHTPRDAPRIPERPLRETQTTQARTAELLLAVYPSSHASWRPLVDFFVDRADYFQI